MKYLSSGWVVGLQRAEEKIRGVTRRRHAILFHPIEKNKPLRIVAVAMAKTFEQNINGKEYEWTKEWASDHFSEVFLFVKMPL